MKLPIAAVSRTQDRRALMSTIESPVVLSDYDWLFKMDEDAVRKRATAWNR